MVSKVTICENIQIRSKRKMTPDTLKLSVVLPAYNEAENIEEVVDKIDSIARQMRLEYELIVVDDGSRDTTRKKAANCANNNSHIRVISYGKNMGKGHAIRTGFMCTCGDFVIFMDSDLDVDPSHIRRYIEALKYGDVVIASKWHPQSSVKVPLIRSFLSHSFNVLVKLSTGLKVNDTQTGFKAIRREALKKILPKLVITGYAFDVELLTLANSSGLKIVELPVNLRINRLFHIRDALAMFFDLLRIAYRLRISKSYHSTNNLSMNQVKL